MDMSQYLGVFIDETKEHLQSLNENLLALENSPEDLELINGIFRVAHTLKGMAGTMGFNHMQKLTHDMENVLSEFRNGKLKVNPNIVDVLFKCLDALEKYTDVIVETGADGTEDNQDLINSLNKIIENENAPQQPANEKTEAPITEEAKKELSKFELSEVEKDTIAKGVKDDGMTLYSITVKLNSSCVLKAARAFILFRELEECGEVVKANPSVEDIEDEKFDLSFSVMFITKTSKEEILKRLNSVAEVENVDIEDISDIIEKYSQASQAQQAAEQQPQTQAQSNSANSSAAENKEAPKAPAASEANKAKAMKSGKTVRVDIDRLDTLMNLVSELIIVKTRLEGVENGTVGQNYQEAVEYLERVTTNLNDAVMKVRMVPVEQVFNRFPRTIRDLARSLNKEIELHIEGEDTELDRIVIDEIGDPLIHLLRNAGDHGLETTEERIAAGKPKKGNIYLRAYQDGNNVVIEVEDDGKGINVEKVKAKAVEKGTVTEEEAAKLSEKEVIDLLFKPGFSTAKEITDVSGRGVGLDVVKSKISSLGGVIETKTALGKGSKFTVRLPMTLTIIQALMVKIGDEKYAIPLNAIQTIEDVKKSDIQYVQNKDVILLRDTVIPIVDLAEILDVPRVENNSESITVVIVKKGDALAGFIVDTLIAQQEIVIRSLGRYLSGIKNITGATILGNGEVALILDTNTLL